MEKVSKVIAHYFFKLRKYLITYKKGIYLVNFAGNSPRAIVESMAKVPLFKQSENTIHSNSLIAIGFLHYYEFEKGFWNFVSSTYHKKNVDYNVIFDPSLPSDYYILTCCLTNESSNNGERYTLDNQKIENLSWSLVKPGSSVRNKFPKSNTVTCFVLYFTKQWFQKNIIESDFEINAELRKFISSDKKVLVQRNINESLSALVAEITQRRIENNGVISDKLKAKIDALNIMKTFISEHNEIIQEAGNNEKTKKIVSPNTETIRMLNVIHSFLYQPFPGLEYIATETGMSTNSLITKFKKQQGRSVFQYFRSKQLELAKSKLQSEQVLIKSVAATFGYSSASKFSAAFKKEFGVLPHEIQMK